MVATLWWWGLAMCTGPFARAEQPRLVLVLTPSSEEPTLSEITARVRGELAGAGFRVVTREAPAGLTPLRAVERAGSDLAPSAVLWIVGAKAAQTAPASFQIWLSDRLLGKVSMARLVSPKGADPRTLSVQAVELLSARLSELRVASDASAAAHAAASWVEQKEQVDARPVPEHRPQAAAPAALTAQAPPRRAWFGAGLGVGVLFGSGALPPLALPVLTAAWSPDVPRTWRAPLAFDARLSAGGYWPRQSAHGPHGSARLDQEFALLGAALRLVTRAPVEPFLGLRAGFYTLGIVGDATAPYREHKGRVWSPLGALDLGLRTRPWAHFSFGASAALLGALSRASVRITDRQVARPGGGMWLLQADLMATF